MVYVKNVADIFKESRSQIRIKCNSLIFESLLPENVEKALDLGCGSGHYTEILANKYKNSKIVGIDISSEMIKIADKKNNIEYVVDDILNLKYNNYDLVTSCCMFCHATTKEELYNMIKICYQQLKNGGKFIGLSSNSCLSVDHNNKIKQYGVYYPEMISDDIIFKKRKDGTPVKVNLITKNGEITLSDVFWSLETYEKMFIDVGFTNVNVRYIKQLPDSCKSTDDFMKNIASYLEQPSIFFITANKN